MRLQEGVLSSIRDCYAFDVISIWGFGRPNRSWCLVVLICNFLMTYDIEHFFICLSLSCFIFPTGIMEMFPIQSRKNWLIFMGEKCF